eukprot:g710.t1
MEHTVLTSEQVSQYLIGNSLYLTGLEFLVEGQELGGFDLTYLKSFFSNTSRFPPEELQRFQGEDALSSLLLAKEREQKLCLAEYELRVANEDLKQTKDQIEQKEASGDAGNGISNNNHSSDHSSISLIEPEKPNSNLKQETNQILHLLRVVNSRKHLNSVVFAYLMHSGYKVTAMTFQEEANPEFEKTPVVEDCLLQYYNQAHGVTNKIASIHSQNNDEFKAYSDQESTVTEMEEDGVSKQGTSSLSIQDHHSPRTPKQITKENDPHLSPYLMTPPPVDLIYTLTDSLPKIIPGILINKRSECIPLICSLVCHHPDISARNQLVQLLFNLIKHPDENQRKVILDGIIMLAKTIGPERTSQEIIPLCCEQVDNKNLDRRLLVAEIIGKIAYYVEKDIGCSLLFSLLRQLSGDPQSTVREASLLSFLSLLKIMPIPPQKQALFEDLLLSYIVDLHDGISEKASKKFMPLLIENKEKGVSMKFLVKILREAQQLLEDEKKPPPSQKSKSEHNENQSGTQSTLVIPRNTQQRKILALLQFYTYLQSAVSKKLPESSNLQMLFQDFVNSQNPPNENGLKTFRNDDSGTLDTSFESTGAKFEEQMESVRSEDSIEFHCFLFEVIPMLLSLIQRISPVNECFKLREKLSSAIKAANKAYGLQVTEAFTKPLMISLSGVKNWISSDYQWIDQLDIKAQEDKGPGYCILPILFSAIITEEGEEEAYGFLRALIEYKSDSEGGSWVVQNPLSFIDIIVFIGGVHNLYGLLLNCFIKLIRENDTEFKIGALLLAEALSLHAPLSDLLITMTPITVNLAEDPGHHEIQLRAISTLQKMVIVYPNESELITTIYNTIEKLMISSGSFEVRLAALSAFSSAVSECHSHAAFVLKQLPSYLHQFHDPELTAGHSLHELASAIFNALRVLEGVEILDSELRGQLVAVMEWMHSDGSPFLDNAHRQILASMLSDKSSSRVAKSMTAPSKTGSPRSLGSSIHKTTFSSDTSYTSEPPGH